MLKEKKWSPISGNGLLICYGLKHVVKMKLSHMQFCCQWHSVKEFYFFCLQMKFLWIAADLAGHSNKSTNRGGWIPPDSPRLDPLFSLLHSLTGWVTIVKGLASKRPGHQFGCWLEDVNHFQENDMKQIWFEPQIFLMGQNLEYKQKQFKFR